MGLVLFILYIYTMARIAGIKLHKTATGKVKSITIDLKKWGSELEDFLDRLDIADRRGGDTVPWEKARKKLNKKHGFKD
jgi:hypothetical protein